MARPAKEIEELKRRIRALPPRDQMRVVEAVMTPEMELHLAVEELRRHVRVRDEREIDRAVRKASRRVRRERLGRR